MRTEREANFSKDMWEMAKTMETRRSPHILTALILTQILLIFVSISNPVIAQSEEKVTITRVDYAAPPDMIAIGEDMPVLVTIQYHDLEGAKLRLGINDDFHNVHWNNDEAVTLSGSGSYTFAPLIITPRHEWDLPLYINQWRPYARILENYQIASETFEVLVENPENAPHLNIKKIEYVRPPDTIAMGEATLIKVVAGYSHLEGGKIEATVRDATGIVASDCSPSISGEGSYTLSMTATPNRVGSWDLEVAIANVAGPLLGDKRSIRIRVVQ